MAAFLNSEQEGLVQQIAERLTDRGETVAVAESTTGGLLSAALLWVPGASRYYAGGGVVYTLNSRVALAGISPEEVADYRGTTPEMLASVAESMRNRLNATWCLAESGLAGPTPGRSGAPPGRTTVSVAGPVKRTEVYETGLNDRETNMVEFTTLALRLLTNVLDEAGSMPRERAPA
jgi:nicotinamide-nucleotide amidase